ncbi:MAG: Polyketide cyclase / dehydrase and lipid transport [Pseudomonadota bacterium]|jgi:uncharacterized protein YndB with AHSA1/START domain
MAVALRRVMSETRSTEKEGLFQLEASCELGAAPEVVFALLSDHASLPSWVPGLRRVEVDCSNAVSPGGVGTRRTLHALAGPPGTEIITDLVAPQRLAYSATDSSLRGLLTQHRAELCCEPSEGGTRLRWSVSGVPSQTWWKRVGARLIFGGAQRAGLRNLRRRFPPRRSTPIGEG